MAQSAEHILGKDEVIGSIPISSSIKALLRKCLFFMFNAENTKTNILPKGRIFNYYAFAD